MMGLFAYPVMLHSEGAFESGIPDIYKVFKVKRRAWEALDAIMKLKICNIQQDPDSQLERIEVFSEKDQNNPCGDGSVVIYWRKASKVFKHGELFTDIIYFEECLLE